MSENVTIEDVRKFIAFLIRELGIYDVDEEGYIIEKNTKKRLTLTHKEQKKEVLIINDVIKGDPIIVNPFKEGVGSDVGKNWFYTTLAYGLNYKIIQLMNFIINCCAISKDDDLEGLSTQMIDFVSEFCNDIDDKFGKEFKLVSNDYLEFCNVFYSKTKREAKFRTIVFEKNLDKFNLRKKSINVLKKYFKKLLNINKEDEISNFKFKSTLLTCPKLESILKVYYLIYERMNKYLVLEENLELGVDLTLFKSFLDNIEAYYNKTKWLVQPVREEEVKETFSPLPSSVPTTESSSPLVTPSTTQPSPVEQVGGVPIVHDDGSTMMNIMSTMVQPQPNLMGGMMNMPMQPQLQLGGMQPNMMGDMFMGMNMSGGMMNPIGGFPQQQPSLFMPTNPITL